MPAPVLSVGSTINATVSVGVLEAATDYKGQRSLPRDFSIELKQAPSPTRRRSGRCWNPEPVELDPWQPLTKRCR